jgi:hypothetical protein
MSNSFFQAFSDVIALFENIEKKYGFKYILVGGVLTPIYAESRQTQDIDIVAQIQVSQENKEILIKIFEEHQFQPLISWEDTFVDWKSTKFIQFLDKSESIKIDLVLMDSSVKSKKSREILKKLSIDNRKRIFIQEIACWATSKEDFILSKLVYKGYQDYKDALACWIRHNNELDKVYLEENARNLQVEEEFLYIVKEVAASDVFSDD